MRFAQTARRHALAGILLGSMALAPASAFAWDQNVVDQFDHFVDCVDLLINDPAAHAAECSPGMAPPAFTHVTGNGHYEPKDEEEPECPEVIVYFEGPPEYPEYCYA